MNKIFLENENIKCPIEQEHWEGGAEERCFRLICYCIRKTRKDPQKLGSGPEHQNMYPFNGFRKTLGKNNGEAGIDYMIINSQDNGRKLGESEKRRRQFTEI